MKKMKTTITKMVSTGEWCVAMSFGSSVVLSAFVEDKLVAERLASYVSDPEVYDVIKGGNDSLATLIEHFVAFLPLAHDLLSNLGQTKMPFGPHLGRKLVEIDPKYLLDLASQEWMRDPIILGYIEDNREMLEEDASHG